MERRTLRLTLAALAVCVAGCAGPTSPDRTPTTSGVPLSIFFRYWGADPETQTLLVRAWGHWGVIYGAYRDVSDEAVWTSSDPSVARVAAPGRVQSVSPGETTLTITVGTRTATERLRVFPGDSPVRVRTVVAGRIRDSSVSGFDNGLPGVTLEILTGHNAGRSAITVARGDFTFSGPFYCGDSMVRLTKAGYRDVVRPLSWCSELPQPDLVIGPG
jgi:hypothetical protein